MKTKTRKLSKYIALLKVKKERKRLKKEKRNLVVDLKVVMKQLERLDTIEKSLNDEDDDGEPSWRLLELGGAKLVYAF